MVAEINRVGSLEGSPLMLPIEPMVKKGSPIFLVSGEGEEEFCYPDAGRTL